MRQQRPYAATACQKSGVRHQDMLCICATTFDMLGIFVTTFDMLLPKERCKTPRAASEEPRRAWQLSSHGTKEREDDNSVATNKGEVSSHKQRRGRTKEWKPTH